MRGDKKGPEGEGPRTGRGLGLCSGSDKPGYLSSEAPMGMGRGGGRGAGAGRRGGGRGFGSEQNESLSKRLDAIEAKIDSLINR